MSAKVCALSYTRQITCIYLHKKRGAASQGVRPAESQPGDANIVPQQPILRCFWRYPKITAPQKQGSKVREFLRHFVRIEAGQWTCVRAGEFNGPDGRIQVSIGSTFVRGTNFRGVDLAQWLDEEYEKINGADRQV